MKRIPIYAEIGTKPIQICDVLGEPTAYMKTSDHSGKQYLHVLLYFPNDENHQHDWTGFLIEFKENEPTMLVTRSHWELLFDTRCEAVYVTPGGHSILSSPLREARVGLPVDYRLFTDNDSLRIKSIERQTHRAITHQDSWGDKYITKWCRRHPYQFGKILNEFGITWKWYQRRPLRPDQLFWKRPDILIHLARKLKRI